jgi:hypothetical protein
MGLIFNKGKIMYWYKIVDKDKKGNFKALFHGIDGSRIIPADEWVKSEQKMVRDGSIGTKYKSGWHIMKDHDECQQYLFMFTADKPRVIVRVKVKGKIWAKEHSPSNIYEFEIFTSEDKYEPIYVGSRDEFIDDLMAHFGIEFRYE